MKNKLKLPIQSSDFEKKIYSPLLGESDLGLGLGLGLKDSCLGLCWSRKCLVLVVPGLDYHSDV